MSKIQAKTTQARPFCSSRGLGDGTTRVADLRIRMPPGPNRIKLTVVFSPKAAATPRVGSPAIWVHADDNMDFSGGTSGPFVVEDVDGTQAAPTAFMGTTADTLGYSREFVTSADYVGAEVTIVDPGQPGTWYAKAEIFPAFTYYPIEAWKEIVASFVGVEVRTPPLTT